MGLFLAIEGIDGAGKTTQALILSDRIRQEKGLTVRLIHEPGGTALGEAIEAMVKGTSSPLALPGQPNRTPQTISIDPRAELLLFAASRAQLIAKVLLPALQKGEVVVSDRFSASTVAYQGYGRGIDRKAIDLAVALATEGLQPHFTILLDLDIKMAMSRKKDAAPSDRFEEEDIAFYERVRKGYLKMAAEDPAHWAVIDAGQPPQKVAEAIWNKVEPLTVPKP